MTFITHLHFFSLSILVTPSIVFSPFYSFSFSKSKKKTKQLVYKLVQFIANYCLLNVVCWNFIEIQSCSARIHYVDIVLILFISWFHCCPSSYWKYWVFCVFSVDFTVAIRNIKILHYMLVSHWSDYSRGSESVQWKHRQRFLIFFKRMLWIDAHLIHGNISKYKE